MIGRILTSVGRLLRHRLYRLRRAWTQPVGGPAGRLRRRWVMVSAGAALVLTVLALPKQVGTAASSVCRISLFQPRLADSCAAIGIPGLPSAEERTAWLKTGSSCEALRAFRRQYPKSSFNPGAERKLALERYVAGKEWVDTVVSEPGQYVGQLQGFDTEALAFADARQRAVAAARDRCAVGLMAGELTATDIEMGKRNCRNSMSGYLCALYFVGVCHVRKHPLMATCE